MRNVRTLEPLWWLLFAAGGTVAAFALPVHALAGLLAGLGLLGDALSYTNLAGLIANPLVKLYLLGLCTLPLFLAAHRLRGALRDLGLRADRLVASLCYGGAILGSVWAAVVVLGVG